MTNEELLQIIEKAAGDKATELDLSDRRITTLPPEIGQLINLRILDLSNNRLASLPSAIGQLTNLTHLYLYGNRLNSLPSEIRQLPQLEELDLRGNLLPIPPEILGGEPLTEAQIELYEWLVNYIREHQHSPSIRQMMKAMRLKSPAPVQSRLEHLRAKGYIDWVEGKARTIRLPRPAYETRRNTPEAAAILNYYFQLQQDQNLFLLKPLNEAKLLLVGQGSVGKTSLVKRLIKDYYDPHERKTEGINIQSWVIQANNQFIRLNSWDFGGQEIMHHTHQFFLTKRSLYLLVLDAREDERQNNLEEWLKIILSFGGDSPVLIVGNKVDQQPLDIDRWGLQTKYENIKAVVETSCATGRGLDELKSVIAREIAALKDVHNPLPQSWFTLKQQLEQMDRDYIPYTEYEQLCQSQGITDDLSQTTLIELLHRLGIVLNFRDDPRLEDTHVLNPEWVTNGVYKLLNDNQLITKFRGILDCTQLNRILDDPRYPRNKQLFIVDMMRKFELCFPLEDGTADRVLIPDLLPKEEPATGEWDSVLAFQYHYNVLPGSIISRFIVRMHHHADRQAWWRSGIVLKHRNNRALVKADREDRKILIAISGPQSTRRELLAMSRSQFDAIHQTIKDIIAEEKVPLPNRPDIVVDYTHLLTLEELGETSFIPSGLKERVSVRQLLDGIEPEEQRRLRQRDREEKRMVGRPLEPEFEKEIFISYAWGGESQKFVDQLEQTLQAKGIEIVRDNRDIGYKGLIKAFMKRIGRGKCVIAVISDKYLKSPNCMFELVQIAKNGEFYDRIFPIVLADAQIYKPIERIKYIKHWENQIKELDEAMKEVSAANLQGFREEIDQYTDIRNAIAELTNLLKDMNTLTSDIHSQSEFEALLNAIEDRLDE
jgi:internalin A